MSRLGRTTTARILLACVAVLLGAGALAAATLGSDGPSSIVAGGRVGAAALNLDGVPTDPPPAPPAPVSAAPTTVAPPSAPVVLPVPVPVPVPTTGPATVPVTRPPTPTSPPPTFVVPPPVSVVTTVPAPLPPGTWAADKDGVSVRMRMEPATPAPGETVTFSIVATTTMSCCVVHLDFGDGSAPSSGGSGCDHSISGVPQVVTHVYAGAGGYAARLVVATIPCITTTLPGGQPVLPSIYGPVLYPCVVVGPTSAKGGC